MDLFKSFFTSRAFIPYGHCYLWKPDLMWLHVTANALIAIACYSIPITLVYFVRKRFDFPFNWKTNKELEREITQRQLVEEALRESEERFRNAFDYAAIGMALVAPDGRWLMVNSALCEIVGYSEQELLAMTFQAITHPDDLENDLNYVRQLLSGEIRHYQTEKRYYHKQGQVVWILLNASLIRDSEGKPLYFVSQIQDITERKQVEAALRQSQERYQTIVEDQTELIARFQPDGTLTFVNEAYCRYFQQSHSDLIGNRYQPFIFPEDLEKIAKLINSLNLETPVGTIEHRVVVAGEVRWMQWINRAIFDEFFCFVEFQSVGRDITQSKQMEEALRDSERRFRAIFNNTFQFTGLLAPDGTLIEANQTALDFGGIQHSDIVGKLFWEARWWTISPETQQQLQEAIASAAKGEFVRYEVDVKGAEDRVATIDFSLKPVTDETGKVVLLIPEGRDISDVYNQLRLRKKAEEQLKASLREKEILLAEIHHRVKNNLHIISNLLFLQANRIKDKKVSEVLQDSRNRIDSMALVHESLYCRVDFNEINLIEYIQKLSIHLLSIYKDKTDYTPFNISSKSDIIINLDQAIPCGLIVNELITNALKHGCQSQQKNEVFITIEIIYERQIVLTVVNNGDTLPDDFDIKNPRSMGLKLVVILAKQLKGSVEFEKGNPTVFRVKFPT